MSGGILEISNELNKIDLMNMCRDFSVSETFTDVQLIAKGGKKVYAHKLVLGAVSPLLKTILASRCDHLEMTTIHLPDISYIILRLVINFLYIGSMRLNIAQKANFLEALKLLEVDIRYIENEVAKPPTQTAQTSQATPSVVTSDPQSQSNMVSAAESTGPIVVNSFSQNPLAMLGMMGNSGNGGLQLPIAALTNHTNSPTKHMSVGTSSQDLSTVGINHANCLTSPQTNSFNQANCLTSPQTNSFNQANCLNQTQQLVQVLPIAFATNDLQQFATSAANLMPTAGGGGGLVAIANISAACSGGQFQQIKQPDGTVQLFATNGGNAATSGLRLMTSTPLMTAAPTVAAAPAASNTIDLSTDDDDGQPPPGTPTASGIASDASPNRSGRRKRQADPDAAAQLAKRLLDACGQLQAGSKDVIDLDND